MSATTRAQQKRTIDPADAEMVEALLDGSATETDYVYHDSFDDPETEERLFGEEAPQVRTIAWRRATPPTSKEDTVKPDNRQTALKKEDEKILFLRYNYARYRLNHLAEKGRKKRNSSSIPQIGKVHEWRRRVRRARADLVQSNMALVLSMAKRAKVPNVEFEELISEGNLALLRCVDKFDISRGYKFSTYACRSILRSFNRLASKTARYRQRFPTQFEPELETADTEAEKHEEQWEDSVDGLQRLISENRAELSEVEKTVVTERFGFASDGKNQTYAKIADNIGLSTERVRRILNNALEKLRASIDESCLLS